MIKESERTEARIHITHYPEYSFMGLCEIFTILGFDINKAEETIPEVFVDCKEVKEAYIHCLYVEKILHEPFIFSEAQAARTIFLQFVLLSIIDETTNVPSIAAVADLKHKYLINH